MKIDPEKCISCLECIDLCTMGCIVEGDGAAAIDQDECVECGLCLRSKVCPTDAIYLPEESKKYPRSLRMQFSDPLAHHPGFETRGRGTEEMKTNDVTGRYCRGEYGMAFEFGRPGKGTRRAEVEKVLKVLVNLDIELEKANPVYNLIEDTKTGQLKPEVLQEKVLSAILEFKFKEDYLEEVVKTVIPVLKQVNTVVSWDLVTRFSENKTLPVIGMLQNMGISVRPNAKINMGMGRPLIDN
jgi:NAD-dependent dihydropyrimidine dehydrogenase PreA subunit